VVRHGLDLGVQHRVIDKVLDPGRAGSYDSDLTDVYFVGAHIGANVIDCPDALGRLIYCRLDTHIPDDNFSRPHLFD
jgi:hypothetical protein